MSEIKKLLNNCEEGVLIKLDQPLVIEEQHSNMYYHYIPLPEGNLPVMIDARVGEIVCILNNLHAEICKCGEERFNDTFKYCPYCAEKYPDTFGNVGGRIIDIQLRRSFGKTPPRYLVVVQVGDAS